MQAPGQSAPTGDSFHPSDFDLWIEADRTEFHYWQDLWRFRELLAVLAWRDIAVRYKQTVVGVAWALLQPLLAMLVMTLVFGRVAGLPSEAGAPYAIMVFAALLPWQLFAGALTNAGQSLVGNAGMISKIYFPRVIIPVAAVAVALADFLVSLVILRGINGLVPIPAKSPIADIANLRRARGAGCIGTRAARHCAHGALS